MVAQKCDFCVCVPVPTVNPLSGLTFSTKALMGPLLKAARWTRFFKPKNCPSRPFNVDRQDPRGLYMETSAADRPSLPPAHHPLLDASPCQWLAWSCVSLPQFKLLIDLQGCWSCAAHKILCLQPCEDLFFSQCFLREATSHGPLYIAFIMRAQYKSPRLASTNRR